MGSFFDAVRAQEPAIDVLRRAVDQDRVASAYLFEGPSGVGKVRTAIALAQTLLGADENTARRIAEGAHPDVRVFLPREEGRRNIQVEQIREHILPFAQYAPFEARAAFLIFPEADVSFPDTQTESANALLKTLEEPRPNVYFVLASERPDRLLPTIRSRAQRVRFRRLPNEVLGAILAERSVEEADRDLAIALADGRADRAIAFAEGDAEAILERAMAIDDVCASGSPGSLTRAAEDLARGDLAIATVLDALSAFYRDVAAAALGMEDASLALHHHAERIRARAQKLGAARAADRVDAIQEAQLALERSGNPQIVLDALLHEARG